MGLKRMIAVVLCLCLLPAAALAAQAREAIEKIEMMGECASGSPAEFQVTVAKKGKLKVSVASRADGGNLKVLENTTVNPGVRTVRFLGRTVNGKVLEPGKTYFLRVVFTAGQEKVAKAAPFTVLEPRPELTKLKTAKTYYPDVSSFSATFELAGAGRVYAAVKNEKGSQVATPADGVTMQKGAASVSWSGKKEGGGYLPGGKYTLHVYYVDSQGRKSDTFKVSFTYDAPPQDSSGGSSSLKEQFLAPATLFKSGYLTQCYVTSKPGGARVSGFTFGESAALKVLSRNSTHSKVQFYSYHGNRLTTGYVRNSQLKTVQPKSPYGVIVDKKIQRASVYRSGKIIKQYKISTGKAMETPSGEFIIPNRKSGFASGSVYARYAVRIVGRVYFHEIPNRNGNYEPYESRLGKKDSGGCVRQPRGIAKWFYDTVPDGTRVIVR